MIDLDGKVDKVLDIVDSKFTSREQVRTDRQANDMLSDNPLAKSIRPIITLWAMGINTILWILSFIVKRDVDPVIIATAGGVLVSAIGFYFNSRRQEKIIANKSNAAIQIEKDKTKQEYIKERREYRLRKRELRKK